MPCGRSRGSRRGIGSVSRGGQTGAQAGVRAGALELHPVRKRVIIYRGARRFEFWDGARLVRSGRVAVGTLRRGDAARALLRHRQVRSGDRPRLGDPRRLRVRDECVLEAHRLAGRRDRRRARNAMAEPPRTGGIARLRQARQPRRRVPAQPRSARDAGQDRPLAERPSRRRTTLAWNRRDTTRTAPRARPVPAGSSSRSTVSSSSSGSRFTRCFRRAAGRASCSPAGSIRSATWPLSGQSLPSDMPT